MARTLLTNWNQVDEEAQKSSGYDNYKYPRVSDFVEIFDRKEYTNNYATIRLLGPVAQTHMHIIKSKTKDGKEVMYYQPCCNFDPVTQAPVDNGCPYCEAGIPKTIKYYENAIIRKLESQGEPGNSKPRTAYENEVRVLGDMKCYMKENKTDGAWTPVRVVEIPKSLVQKLKNLENLNYYKDENGERKTTSLTDLKYGVDLLIRYSPDQKEPAQMYDVQRDYETTKTPISSEDRKKLLLWNIYCMPEVDVERIKSEFKRSCSRITNAKNPEYIKSLLEVEAPQKKKEEQKPVKTVSLDDNEMTDIENEPVRTPVQEMEPEDLDPVTSSHVIDDEFEDLD